MGVFKKVRKDPDAERTFTLDWANGGPNDGSNDDKGFLQGQTIVGLTVVADTGITVLVESFTTTTTSTKLGGGSEGKRYNVVHRIDLSGGDQDDRTLEVLIEPK